MLEHILDRLLQLLLGPALGCQPAVLHQPPHHLDAIELWVIGLLELEPDAMFLELRERTLDRTGKMDAGGIKHDDKRLASSAVWSGYSEAQT